MTGLQTQRQSDHTGDFTRELTARPQLPCRGQALPEACLPSFCSKTAFLWNVRAPSFS